MGHAGAGFVHRLHVGLMLQLLFAQFRQVELAQHLTQQMEMPGQRRAQIVLRVDAQQQFLVGVFHCVLARMAEFAAIGGTAPGAAADPGEPAQAGAGLLQKFFRLRFPLRQLGEEIQPLLERQADRQQVSGEQHGEAGKARARVPGEPEQQQHPCDQ